MTIISTNTQEQEYTQASFQALTDAILPPDSEYAYDFPDMGVHAYIIYALDHYVSIQQQLHHTVVPLAYPTAVMLDTAAAKLVYTHQAHPSPQSHFPGGGMFSFLSRQDRIRTLAALENLYVDMYALPSPYQNNAGLVKHVTDALNRFSMFGYYSEWPAYGSTRLYPPDSRRLQFFPPGWQQVGYPGVSLGYRDFRGFLLKMGRSEVE
ncbi:hypothetical protein KFZ58_14785 [Virgibacillus sp. NKC19-16]|uniref:hypothetical protein n=1 Tax=Virgibacillus salidurans TaxID=2831673 RepID=UPI001F169DD2|nr:hypothetical protein [Virgibacillus sp. NKC19-16]UJL45645.1 hypothetical protein KFZ58_14785 [Virgibacillus sp. NKC19-16]